MKPKYDHRLPNRAGSLHLRGGNLALDFANTESGRNGPQHLNHLQSAADIVIWARHAEVIDAFTAAEAQASAKEHQAGLLAEGVALRQAIYQINAALAAGQSPTAKPIQDLAHIHGKTLQSAHLVANGNTYSWAWGPSEELTNAILGPIAQAALVLLMQQDRARIKQCQGNHCGWLFYDTSKNNSRRWCDMSVCGNRSKIRALRKRREPLPLHEPNHSEHR